MTTDGRVRAGTRPSPGASRKGSALPSWQGAYLRLPTGYLYFSIGPVPSGNETLVEETPAESSEDEVIEPSQVTAGGLATSGS